MKEILKRILVEWQENELPTVTRRSYVYDPSLPDILAVIGPRRAGKTYFLYQIIGDLVKLEETKTDFVFVNFEDYRLSGFRMAHFQDVVDAHYELYGKKPKYLFFDEIQNITGYGKALRTLKDQGYKVAVTGSSSKLLVEEISTELRGRYVHLLVLPFSFGEVLAYRGVELRNVEHSVRKGDVLRHFSAYLETGGFPALLDRDEGEKRKTLANYYQTVFYHDVLERHGIKARFLFEYLMKYALDSYATTFSLGKFHDYLGSQGVQGSKKTVANYFHHLQEAFFILPVNRFSFSPRKSILSPKKIYLADNGFTLLSSNYSDNLGRRLENLFAVHLFRQEKEFFYFQKKRECDFVVKNGNAITEAIQVCYELKPHNREREIAGLTEAMEAFGLSEGTIVTYGQSETIDARGHKIRVVPAWKILL